MLLPVPEEAKQQHVDKSVFNMTKHVAALRVPKQRCQELIRKFKGYTLDRPKLRCVVSDGTREDTRLLLLSDKTDMPEGLSEELKSFIASEGFEVVKDYGMQLDYGHLTADYILKALLPEGVDAPSSFETIGHIVHLNLRDNQLPYKYVIGQVLLDKNPHVKTVVNKVGSIDNTFRVFAMELLAGEPRTEAEVVQHGLRFKLDMAQVYWNSRLEAEHHRLVHQYFKPREVVADIMAGVGPFAIPAALQGCTVYANDLNPSSTHYLRANARLNRVTGAVHVFTLDGRAFVRLLCATPGHGLAGMPSAVPHLPQTCEGPEPCQVPSTSATQSTAPAATPAPGSPAELRPAREHPNCSAAAPPCGPDHSHQAGQAAAVVAPHPSTGLNASVGPPAVPHGFKAPSGGIVFQHAIMNLPASAVDFVDAFKGAFEPSTWKGRLPLVHLYTFKAAAETETDVLAKIQRIMGGPFEAAPTVHWVRDVSPGKVMLCVTFRVPEAVAFHGRGADGSILGTEQAGVTDQSAHDKEEGDGIVSSDAKRQRT